MDTTLSPIVATLIRWLDGIDLPESELRILERMLDAEASDLIRNFPALRDDINQLTQASYAVGRYIDQMTYGAA